MNTVYKMFDGLTRTGAPSRLGVASRRLNLCSLREAEDDAILDAAIGLEALVCSDERTEITYKLSLRVAALLHKLRPEMLASDVFRNMKHVYDFRSSVVHGDAKKIESKRFIRTSDQGSISTIAVANEYLRLALRSVLEYPEFLDTKIIDERLLLSFPPASLS